jgi:hypothetical protein
LVGKDLIIAKKDRLGHNTGDYQIVTVFRNMVIGMVKYL